MMQIDKKILEKAAQLPEDRLRELVYQVITAAGGSKLQARAAAANTDKLKKKLNEITDEDVEKAVSSLDGSQLQKIVSIAKEKGIGNDE
ncbi:MAG: hypothetical protein IJU52_09400 [Clostridia bacterium]|nr:hypothetical protein [Clostridia bacterium]